MQDWLAQLSQRERILVLSCGALVLVALLWTLAVRPLFERAANLDARVAQKTAQLANFQELAGQYQPAGSGRPGGLQGRNQSIVVVIDRTTRQRQLDRYLKRNQPEGNGVRLRFEGAPFDSLVGWLGELRDRYGMTTQNASIDQAGPGRVNVSLVLNRQGT